LEYETQNPDICSGVMGKIITLFDIIHLTFRGLSGFNTFHNNENQNIIYNSQKLNLIFINKAAFKNIKL